MPRTLESVDPQWAWKRFEPTNDQPWNRKGAAHLFRRAGFAATPEQLRNAVDSSPESVVQQLVQNRSETPEFIDEITALSAASLATGNPRRLAAWWLHRLLNTPDALREKVVLFWHGHFATGAEKVEDAQLMFAQNELFRTSGLGRFRELVQAVSRDPAMLIYLDSVTNRKAHPNENYAREVMELFCLGEGEYTEEDIRELARCFTGWEIRRDQFRFNKYQHDTGTKTILGEEGIESGEEGVDVVVNQPACPRFLCRKLFRFFVTDAEEPSDDLIQPLADELRANDLEIGPTVQRMLSSNLFFSELAYGRKIRSPIELSVGLLHSLEASTNIYTLEEGLRVLGQELFYPPNVKGWDGGRTWINSSTLLGRANLVRQVLDNEATRFGRGSLTDFCRANSWERGEQFVRGVVETLFAAEPSQSVQRDVATLVDNTSLDEERRRRDALHWLCSLPEFQLG
ncbi:MAG: DUF1800 domain-containing protein [Planctomycetaceae bacterium]|nr:DUF1800 domain-containing protein [Planctomycetaceae bacterium]MCB9950417.1 DUF1800 domain-containing protein [Planctomycetaceae bacterium]